MSWTDDRVETLKRMWAEGQSASQIAKELGGVTRNAVIGKVHRLGLSGRATPSKPARPVVRVARPRPAPTPARRAPVAAAVSAPTPPQTVVARREEPGSATVLTLGVHMCKWPIGDPSSRDFTFCGRGTNGTYCDEHARVAYQPVQKKAGGRSQAADLARSLRRYM